MSQYLRQNFSTRSIEALANSAWHLLQLFPWWFYIPVGIVLLTLAGPPLLRLIFPGSRSSD